MSSIIIPRKSQTQPQYAVQLDQKYLQGVGGSLYLGRHIPLTNRTQPLTTTEEVSIVSDNNVRLAKITDGTGYWGASNNYHANFFDSLVAGPHTLVFVHRPLATTANRGYVGLYTQIGSTYASELRKGTTYYTYDIYGSTTVASYVTDEEIGTTTVKSIVVTSSGLTDTNPVIAVNGRITALTVTPGAGSTRAGVDTLVIGLDRNFNAATNDVAVYLWLPFRVNNPDELSLNPWQIFRKQPQILYFDVGAAGAQTLTPSLYEDGDTFHAATVSAGAVTLTPALYSDGDTFHDATVTLGGAAQSLTPDLFADGDTFHNATVAAGSVNLAPSLVTDDDTFHSATVAAGAVTLTPGLVSDGDTFYTHALVLEGGPQTLSPDLFADGDTFHAATVTPGAVTLMPSLYTDADTFHAAEIASGFNLQPPAYADPETFYPATVARGAVSLAPSLFADGDAFYVPTVTFGQVLAPALFVDVDSFYAPVVFMGDISERLERIFPVPSERRIFTVASERRIFKD